MRLNAEMMAKSRVPAELEADDGIGCVILTGSDNETFAAGADKKEMVNDNYLEHLQNGSL